MRRRRRQAPEHPLWFVEIEPQSWLAQRAPNRTEARVAAFRMVPNGRGPWTVRSEAELEKERA